MASKNNFNTGSRYSEETTATQDSF